MFHTPLATAEFSNFIPAAAAATGGVPSEMLAGQDDDGDIQSEIFNATAEETAAAENDKMGLPMNLTVASPVLRYYGQQKCA